MEIEKVKDEEKGTDIQYVLSVFKKARKAHEWGVYSAIRIYDDGSGCVVDNDDETVIEFDSIKELVEKLERNI